jgi:hypothetical protein
MCICVYATSGRHGDAFRRIPSCNWSTQVIVQIETAASATGVLRANESLKTRSRLIIAHLFDTCLRSRMRSVISSFGRQLGSNSVNKQYHGLYSSSQRLLNCCNTARVIPAALTCRHCCVRCSRAVSAHCAPTLSSSRYTRGRGIPRPCKSLCEFNWDNNVRRSWMLITGTRPEFVHRARIDEALASQEDRFAPAGSPAKLDAQ